MVNDNPLNQRSAVPGWPRLSVTICPVGVRAHEKSFTEFAASASPTKTNQERLVCECTNLLLISPV